MEGEATQILLREKKKVCSNTYLFNSFTARGDNVQNEVIRVEWAEGQVSLKAQSAWRMKDHLTYKEMNKVLIDSYMTLKSSLGYIHYIIPVRA